MGLTSKDKKFKIPIFNPNTRFKRKTDGFLFTEIDDEAVLMNTESGLFIGMNSTTVSIWNQFEAEKSIDEVVKQLTEEYDVSQEVCLIESRKVIGRMFQLKLIQRIKD